MSLSPNTLVELTPEKPVVGGRILARVDGEVVLVAGAIPGERVTARVERRQQGVWFATVTDVLEPSIDRRDPGPDPACGGMAFAHVEYLRQCQLKSAIVSDALTRIAKVEVPGPIPLIASPTSAYRTRYRVHAASGRLGFYREATHDVCDPAASGQLAGESLECLAALARVLPSDIGTSIDAFELIENLPNTERVVNLSMRTPDAPARHLVACIGGVPGLTGVSMTGPRRPLVTALHGQPWVSDPVDLLRGTDGSPALMRRHAPAFFQANRFLTPVLAAKVGTLVAEGPVIDLYAGVGLFAVTLAAAGRTDVAAVESDAISLADLEWNAGPFERSLTVFRSTVEDYLRAAGDLRTVTLIVDPPRTGMSRLAMQGILGSGAERIVYVSCDVATLARDTRRLIDAGYRLAHVEALDLFPNTAHVEAIARFDHA